MRTTLTLDDDIRAKLEREMRRSGKPFKQVVNEFLRFGLTFKEQFKPSEKFTVKARPLGTFSGLNYDNIADLLEQIEGPTGR